MAHHPTDLRAVTPEIRVHVGPDGSLSLSWVPSGHLPPREAAILPRDGVASSVLSALLTAVVVGGQR